MGRGGIAFRLTWHISQLNIHGDWVNWKSRLLFLCSSGGDLVSLLKESHFVKSIVCLNSLVVCLCVKKTVPAMSAEDVGWPSHESIQLHIDETTLDKL